jgi:phage terminase Nu1 subunit (DNA packaging protein)
MQKILNQGNTITMNTPKPPTRAALAAALGVSPARINQLKDNDGMPTHSIEAAVAWREKQGARQHSKSDSAEELRVRRIALLAEQERKARIENAVRENQLVAADEVRQAMFSVCSKIRARFLSLPATLAPVLAGLDEPRIAVILRREILDVLNELSEAGCYDVKTE